MTKPIARASAKLSQDTEKLHRQRIGARLARIEGQIHGIQSMVSNNSDCEAVVQQITAARRALDRVFYEMLACSLMSQVESSAGLEDIRASTYELARLLTKFG
jgi:DNA-binding FrmR family transcriptional regulator